MAIAQQRFLQNLQRATELQREGRSHSGVARIGVALRAGFVVLQENLADRAVGISADSSRVAQATDLKLERLGQATIGKAPGASREERGGRITSGSEAAISVRMRPVFRREANAT